MHFVVLVLIDKPISRAHASQQASELLEPYSEHNRDGDGCRWDWWVVGGRWTGYYSGYDASKDPRNQETYTCCNGTGLRDDDIGKKSRIENSDYKCNGCDGTGKTVAFRLVPHEGDIMPVKAVLAVLEQTGAPCAVLTPDGEWHEKDVLFSEKNAPEIMAWEKEVRDILESHRECYAVVADCHS